MTRDLQVSAYCIMKNDQFIAEAPQSKDVQDSPPRRAPPSGNQAAVWLHQDALSRPRKNASQVFTLIGLTNIYLKRQALMMT